jgi:hypothetical protein
MKYTGHIYNDLECYRYHNIMNRVQIALCSTKSDTEYNAKEKKKTNCEIVLLLEGTFDPFIYRYDNINDCLCAAYFLWMIDKKREDIIQFQVWLNEEITHIFDLWTKEYKPFLEQENTELKEKIGKVETALKKYGTTINKLIEE